MGCDSNCAPGFVPGLTPLKCVKARWQADPKFCQEAKCGAPAAADYIGSARRCQGTASRQWCEYDCPDGRVLSSPLYCLRGKWVNEATATCQRLCVKVPEPILNSVSDLSLCIPSKAGQSCPLVCRTGYWPSGALLCDPKLMEWNMPTCNSQNHTFFLRVHYGFQMTGLQARSKNELRGVTDSLLRALARLLRLNSYTMQLTLQAHAPSLPPVLSNGAMHLLTAAVAPPSTDFKAQLRVNCERCEFVLRRLHLVGQTARAFDAALAKGVCSDRCMALPERPLQRGQCLRSCPEAKSPLQTLYRSEPIIEQSMQ